MPSIIANPPFLVAPASVHVEVVNESVVSSRFANLNAPPFPSFALEFVIATSVPVISASFPLT